MKHEMIFEIQKPLRLEDESLITTLIDQDTQLKKVLKPVESFGIFFKDSSKKILAGLTGYFFYGSLHIDQLWVDPNLRDQGIGSKLILESEIIAKKEGCLFLTVNTMDFQALEFYKKNQFSIEFIREGFFLDSKMYLMRKQILNEV